jgi:hypothetical protein
MPKLPPVHILAPTIVRYTFQHTLASGPKCDNVMDISVEGDTVHPRDMVIDDFNMHICGYWQDTALARYSSLTAFNGAAWIDQNDVSGRTGHLGPAGGHPTHGSLNGPFAPPNVSVLVRKQTASHRGQRGGRTYIGDTQESAADDRGNLAAGTVTATDTAMNAFRTAVAGYNLEGFDIAQIAAVRVVHVHKPDKLDPSTWTWSSTDVSSFSTDTMVATQRRRLR